jgi:hypothetical protein
MYMMLYTNHTLNQGGSSRLRERPEISDAPTVWIAHDCCYVVQGCDGRVNVRAKYTKLQTREHKKEG